MNPIRLSVWTLLVGAPLACMSARNDQRERPRGDATRPVNVAASYFVRGDAPDDTLSPRAEPLGSGGTSSSSNGGRSAGGHAGKNTRNGKDSHNTQ